MIRLPATLPGMRIGLFGGSFDPPHAGHLHASRLALRKCRLDRIWWLVTPANPLKPAGASAALDARLEAAQRLAARDPRVAVTAIEAALGTRSTAELAAALQRQRPGMRFVLIVGADNWATFHRWQRWRALAEAVPIAVVDRPGATLAALGGPAARTFASERLPQHDAGRLPDVAAPAWVFLTGARIAESSSRLRDAPD